jgi:hypothetical protein
MNTPPRRPRAPFLLAALACLASVLPRLMAAETTAPASTVYAEVVALDQPWWFNRLGASQPGGMIFALASDVVVTATGKPVDIKDTSKLPGLAGKVSLRPDKRPRPIVLRVNAGQTLHINFTNLLAPTGATDGVPTRAAGFHVAGLELEAALPGGQPGINNDATWVGTNGDAYARPGKQATYRYYAKAEGTFYSYSAAADWNGQTAAGLFGTVVVEPAKAEWYRSQVTHADLMLAAYPIALTKEANRLLIPDRTDVSLIRKVSVEGVVATALVDGAQTELWSFVEVESDRQTVHKQDVVVRDNRVFTPDGRPLINYNATYPTGHPRAGLPILKMTKRRSDGGDDLVYSDLAAIITGPGAGEFPFTENGPGFYANPTYPNRRQPFREFAIMYHEVFLTAQQAFPQFNSPQLGNVLGGGADTFAINYGTAGIGAEVLASRLGVGPMGGKKSVDLKFEEFFLSSWANGDPSLVVDVPANTVTHIATGGAVPPAPTNTPSLSPTPPGERATKAYYPDDPSNVYHSYMRDHVTMRLLHTGTQVSHVHHLHAHQWLRSPNSDESQYLDSQMIAPGSTYTLEMVYNGSGNRNETVGDAIFHCHFYPHFAGGMWALWRVHDVFEAGTELDSSGRPKIGVDVWNRALPDAEIVTGTPIPAIVPMPTLAMAPVPAPVRLIEDGTRVYVKPTGAKPDGEPTYNNPGYPFFIPGVSGHRAPHPPLDFGWEETSLGQPKLGANGKKIYLDGGLPRHQVLDGTIVRELHTRWDFSKDFIAYNDKHQPIAGGLVAFELPEDGTAVEKAAMQAHATRTHASVLPNGDPGNFILNGLPPVPGAPFANPSVDDNGNGQVNTRRYQGAAIQMDVALTKQGWHYPQQRMLTLWQDVQTTISGERAPQPLFFRANTGETIEFWHSNLVPDYYDLDDFQIRTPTDIIGQHIHLVKFDVLASDGAANGWNYEDGTFSPDEVRGRIDAINRVGGLFNFDAKTQFKGKAQSKLTAKPAPAVFGTAPAGQDWAGAQTTIQRWDTDPVENNKGEDRTLRTVFTHDHFGPSTHQQVGLYGGLLVEPQGSKWYDPISGGLLYDTKTRSDGGPTSWQANIVTANPADSYREFALEFADFQLAYTATSKSRQSVPTAPLFTTSFSGVLKAGPISQSTANVSAVFSSNGVVLASNAALAGSDAAGWTLTSSTAPGVDNNYRLLLVTPATSSPTLTYQVMPLNLAPGWASPAHAINPPAADIGNQTSGAPFPNLISGFPPPGTYSLNYRGEPIPARVWDPAKQQPAAGAAGDLSFAYSSIVRADPKLNVQPIPKSPINTADPTGFKFPANLTPTVNGPILPQSAAASSDATSAAVAAIASADVGKVQPTDPFSPMLRAYAGDKVQVRTLVGAHHNPHFFSIDGVKWLYEPGSSNTGYRNHQPMGISEHFEMLFKLPASTAATANPFADYLYNANAGVDGVTTGIWGIMRSYKQKVDQLVPLPNNPLPTSPSVASITPPAGAKVRKFTVVATSAQQALGGPLTYNNRGAVGSPLGTTPIQNPNALIYFHADDLTSPDAKGTLKPGRSVEPLILRAAAGEWIELTLINAFNTASLPAAFSAGTTALPPYGNSNFFVIPAQSPSSSFTITPTVIAQFKAAGYTLLPSAVVTTLTSPRTPVSWTVTPPSGATGAGNMDYSLTLSGNQILVSPTVMMNTSPQVGLNPQVVGYDITKANGVNIGFNTPITVAPGQTSAPVYWYAGTIAFEQGVMKTTPIEFGGINLNPSDPLLQHTQGLVGALVIEPENSTWTEDRDMRPAASAKADAKLTRASATVTRADGTSFRDFVLLTQDDLPLAWGPATAPAGTTSNAVNYGTEPMAYRYLPAVFNNPNGFDSVKATANQQVGSDPQTPIYRAMPGQEAHFHMLHPASARNADGETLTLDGHVFQEEPYTHDSRVIGYNPLSQWFGTRGSHGARDRFEVVIASAGGDKKVPGDYLYRSTLNNDISNGVWGIFRVGPFTVEAPVAAALGAVESTAETARTEGPKHVESLIERRYRDGRKPNVPGTGPLVVPAAPQP